MIVEEKKADDFKCAQLASFHCIGSRCMAWRWAIEKVTRTDDDPNAVARDYYINQPSTTHGYCGLAGRP